jgi:hypothetical protein
MSYKQVFGFLPKVIEDVIYEFNAGHRELMKPVLLDILSTPYKCMGCHEPINKNKYRKMDFRFCSVSCYDVVDEKYPDNCYHPYIEVLMYGDDYYDGDLINWATYYD